MSLTKEDLNAIGELLDVKLKAELQPIKEDVAELKERVVTLEDGQKRTSLIIENEICPKINLLIENYVPASKRYQEATAQIEDMQDDIIMLKKVVTSHSKKFQMLGG